MPFSRRWLHLGALATTLLTAPLALAERSRPRIVVQSPEAALCPSEAELVERVERRLLASSVVDERRSFDVTIEAVPQGLSGRLSVRDMLGTSERVVEAESCTELFESLAFIVAMTIDPTTASRAQAELASPPPAPAPSEAGSGASPAQPGAQGHPATGKPHAITAARPNDRGRSETTAADHRSPNVVYELGGGVEATSAVAPGFTPVARLFGAVRFASLGDYYPSLRLSGARSVERDAEVDSERGGHLTWTAGRVETCITTGFGTTSVLADVCPAGDIGVLDAEGYGVEPSKSPARTWFSVDLVGRLAYVAGDRVVVEAESGLVIPVTRDSFFVRGPDAEVFQPPDAAFTLGAAVALKLP